MKRLLPIFFIIFIAFTFFWQFIFKSLYPIPSDTIVGLYHPFRDLYSKEFPRGVPFKNFLITDPVRQQYPWRYLAINLEKNLELPLWNPYNFAGTPLLANHQSAALYPLNLLFFILPFNFSWSILIILQPLLAGIFLFLYLNNFKLNRWAGIIGSITFSFSGFSIAWMEWNTILHTALWLPLILLATDKIVFSIKYSVLSIKNKNFLIWGLIFVLSLTSAFFAGHLQTFFYLFITSTVYLIVRWAQYGRIKKILFIFLIFYLLFFILTFVQWYPLFQFILFSARSVDQIPWQNPGWFIPWQNLIQFIAPDFFGNPTTLNYWGEWNYGEFLGYIGVFPLIFSLYSLFFRRDRKTLFFGTIFFLSLILALPTIFAKIPFILNIPFINTTQPTRLLFLTDFSLAVLASFGFDYFLKMKNKKEIFHPIIFILIILICLWLFVYYGRNIDKNLIIDNLLVAKRNIVLPTLIFLLSSLSIFFYIFFHKKNKNVFLVFSVLVLSITIFDLFRAGWKFTPFTKKDYLFPQTKILSFLQEKNDNFRVMSTDSRILPPNFSIIYKIQSIEGYDPLYLRRYAELITASKRGVPNIKPPFGFNRIITPYNYSSKIIDLLGVKYILSLADLKSGALVKVFQEGEARVYENKNVLPRAFFVNEVKNVAGKTEAINEIFRSDFDPFKTAIVENFEDSQVGNKNGKVNIVEYRSNKIIINTENENKGFLVLTDSFYPTWRAEIDGVSTKIYLTNFDFRGIVIEEGKHEVVFSNSLL
ncbi:MAG: YfhO family protein [Candidatus Levybacteria bacterium]|nr:YfhO family protein [Candidatus Levybacteria bacterium]